MNPMIFIILLVIVIGLRLAIRGAFTKVPRRYRAFAAVLLVALVLAANYYLPARDPVRRRTQQTVMVVVLVAVGIIAVGASLKRHRTGWKVAEWAAMQGFTVVSDSRLPAAANLPESLRQLPLLRIGQEPETFFVLEDEDRVHRLQTMIFGYVVSRIEFSVSAMGPRDRPLTLTVFAFRQPARHLPVFELRPAFLAKDENANEPREPRLELAGKPQFAERYTLRGRHAAEIESVFSDALVSALERESGWCLESMGEWCIAYRYYQATTFWTFRPSRFEYCADPDQLAARLETARSLFELIREPLPR